MDFQNDDQISKMIPFFFNEFFCSVIVFSKKWLHRDFCCEILICWTNEYARTVLRKKLVNKIGFRIFVGHKFEKLEMIKEITHCSDFTKITNFMILRPFEWYFYSFVSLCILIQHNILYLLCISTLWRDYFLYFYFFTLIHTYAEKCNMIFLYYFTRRDRIRSLP